MMTAEQLRASILLLAMQGKLVEQRPDDGSADDLYEAIQKDRQKKVKDGKLKKQKPLQDVSKDHIPFEIPDNWKWVKLGNILTVLGGKRIPVGRKLTTENTGHVYIRVSDMKNASVRTDNLLYVPEDVISTISRYIIKKEDIYITVAGTIGVVGTIPAELDGANLTENADRLVFNLIDKDWLVRCLQSSVVQKQISDATTKVGQPKLAIKRIQELIIPLPPLIEQKRIVAKIEKLMPFVDQYAATSTKLNTLNASFPDMMKKSILQEAVRGKLVPQDPNDEPANDLLKRIAEEKQRLIKEGKIKKQKADYSFSDEDLPFDVPESWSWARLGDICYDLRYGTSSKSNKTGDVIVLRMGNIQDGEIDYTDLVYSSNKEDNNKYKLEPLDILFNRTNSRELVGKTGIYRGEHPAIFAGYLVQVRPIEIDPEYLNYVMNSEYERNYCKDVKSDGINQSNVNATKIGQFLIPIPPINEQHRIVDQLNGILPMVKVYQQKYGI